MLPAVASADTVTVNTTADHNDKFCNETTPGDCTLREAVELATNESGKPITAINLPKGHYTLTALGELQLVERPHHRRGRACVDHRRQQHEPVFS